MGPRRFGASLFALVGSGGSGIPPHLWSVKLLRVLVYLLAIAGIGASIALPWWRVEGFGMSLEITLRGATACAHGECASASADGAFGLVGMMTTIQGLITLVVLAWGGLVPALTGDASHVKTVGSAAAFLVLALLSLWTLDVPAPVAEMIELRKTGWFWAGIGGALLGAAAAFIPLGDVGLELGVDASPEPAPLPAATVVAGGAAAAAARASRATAPPSPPRHAPIDLDPGLGPAPAAPAAPGSGLRFAVARATLGPDGIEATGEDGARRAVRWADVGGLLARDVAPAEDAPAAMIVDLVPRGGAPVRLVEGARLDLGGADAAGRDALRRAIAYVRAMSPDVELEEATADFLYRGAELPAWTHDDLARYDARYRAARSG